MADRREQLMNAFNEVEDDEEKDLAGGESGDVDDKGTEEHDSAGADVIQSNVGADKNEAAGDDIGAGKDAEGAGAKSGSVDTRTNKSAAKDAGTGKRILGADGKPIASKVTAKEAAGGKTLEQTEQEAAATGEAPKAWKVATREHWAKLPTEVREEVQRRETEITQFIGRHGAAIQHKQQFDEAVQPFLPFIAAQQSTPLKAFHSLMTTAARLTTGAPQAKAQVISEIMRNYGVDAKTLDEVLSAQLTGKAPLPAQNAGNDAQPPAWAQPLFGFMTEATKAKQERERRVQTEAAAELQAFEKRPFFSDLQEDIGLIMSRAAGKGQVVTLEQAYEKARKLNPEVDAILTQREKAAKGNTGAAALEKARRAASSVRGAPASGVAVVKTNGSGNGKPTDRRAALSAAIDSLSED